MLIGSFELNDDIGALRDPVAVATLLPWLDAGSVGSLALRRMQDAVGAREVGHLRRPGEYFDFTRYRPTVRYKGDEREFVVPNSRLSVARRDGSPDLLFMDVLEPHARAEEYIDSLLAVMRELGVKVHWRIGAWFGGVPHSRPLRVSMSLGSNQVDWRTRRPIARSNRYEGPTSVMSLLNARFDDEGIESNGLTLQIPQYVRIEEDFSAVAAMLEAAGDALGIAAQLQRAVGEMRARGERQYEQLSRMVAMDADLRRVVEQLEQSYDAERPDPEPPASLLSPEIEAFLGEVTRGIDTRDSDS